MSSPSRNPYIFYRGMHIYLYMPRTQQHNCISGHLLCTCMYVVLTVLAGILIGLLKTRYVQLSAKLRGSSLYMYGSSSPTACVSDCLYGMSQYVCVCVYIYESRQWMKRKPYKQKRGGRNPKVHHRGRRL